MGRPKIFNRVAAGSLAILLTSCTNIKAPKTLFITLGASEEYFSDDLEGARAFLSTYTEAFQNSNPDISIVYITYPSRQFFNQIAKDTRLNLGPDLMITNQYEAQGLLSRNLTLSLENQQYFDSIYNTRIQSIATANGAYRFAPWLIDTQIACFDNTKIKTSPSTIEELETLSASGIKIGLASNPYELLWSAGSLGAISELSSLGTGSTSDQPFPGIKKWLKWLEKAALYQNISFHKDTRELGKKLEDKKLTWITCWGSQLKDLKKTMGASLGVAALPNGATSKAFPVSNIYSFSLGKDSSRTQRAMAMKFIKTAVNNIAQRKIQLDDVGLLAANKNVSIPPESSRRLSALNISFNEQSESYAEEQPGLERYARRNPQFGRALGDLIDGYLNVNEAFQLITTRQTK